MVSCIRAEKMMLNKFHTTMKKTKKRSVLKMLQSGSEDKYENEKVREIVYSTEKETAV